MSIHHTQITMFRILLPNLCKEWTLPLASCCYVFRIRYLIVLLDSQWPCRVSSRICLCWHPLWDAYPLRRSSLHARYRQDQPDYFDPISFLMWSHSQDLSTLFSPPFQKIVWPPCRFAFASEILWTLREISKKIRSCWLQPLFVPFRWRFRWTFFFFSSTIIL